MMDRTEEENKKNVIEREEMRRPGHHGGCLLYTSLHYMYIYWYWNIFEITKLLSYIIIVCSL